MGPNRVGVFLASPEDGNRFSFRNVVFSSCFEYGTMDKDHKASDSECYILSSEPYRLCVLINKSEVKLSL
jgi:hypothetical protein